VLEGDGFLDREDAMDERGNGMVPGAPAARDGEAVEEGLAGGLDGGEEYGGPFSEAGRGGVSNSFFGMSGFKS